MQNLSHSESLQACEKIAPSKSGIKHLTEAKASLRDVEEQLNAALGVLGRTTIRAPVDGIVVTSAYNVVGNVISPGEKVMEILPTSEQPLIEARVKPTDNYTSLTRRLALRPRKGPGWLAAPDERGSNREIHRSGHRPLLRQHRQPRRRPQCCAVGGLPAPRQDGIRARGPHHRLGRPDLSNVSA
nr:HlyD family efflux transporter periplasmic adaptor subunit [Rhizobium leguminosarum]